MSDSKAAHVFARAELDWYVEPEDCTEALLRVERFMGRIWDPACGGGNIIRAALPLHPFAYGTDLVDRGWDEDKINWRGELDFLACDPGSFLSPNIITNPPFGRGKLTEAFIRHALSSPRTAKLAVFTDLKFLASTGRAKGLYADLPPSRVWILTPRPSCPPGEYLAAGNKAGGGTADWCWMVWDRTAPASATELRWLHRGPVISPRCKAVQAVQMVHG